MPPVLHIALGELPPGGPHDMLAREIGAREQQGEHVLQLVAIAVRAAWLVEAGAGPEAAAHVLVQEPPVDQHVK